MISRTAACLAGVLGGLCWVARYVLSVTDVAAAGGQVGTALRWSGATWVLLALVSGGSRLARASAVWLRVLLGVAVFLLAIVALSLLYPVTGRLRGDALFGAVAALTAGLVWMRGRTAEAETPVGSSGA